MSIRTLACAFALAFLLTAGGAARAQEPAPAQPAPVQPAPQPAPAQPAPEEITAEDIAGGVFRNIRRSIAIGPTFGLFSTYAPGPSELDAGLSFGLELELFKSGIPTPARVREIAREKAQEKLAQIIRDRFGGQRPDPAILEQLLREIAAQVKAEVLAAIGAKPPLVGRPRLAIPIEASYAFGPADWLARAGFAIGIGPVSIGPTLSVRFGDDTVARLGGELGIHLLPTKGPRSPVLDIFLRGDFELHARDTNDDQISLGIRALLDLI